MRAINRSAVLEYFRLAQTVSRTEIANQLHFSKPTAMRIIDRLMADGLVRSVGQKEGGKGRSRELLELNTADNLVVGIDVGGSHISGVITNIGGEIIRDIRTKVVWKTPEENFETLAGVIRKVLGWPRDNKANLLGIAIGIPGIIESQRGVVKLAPSLEWADFPLLGKLEEIFDLPVIIENDVNLAALGEHWFGAGVGVDNLIMIAIGTGIGAGIILDGKLHRGFRESSGEIGYLIPGIQFLDNQYPGFGALEIIASGRGIAERGAEKRQKLVPGPAVPDIDAAYVFQAARDGENWAVQVIAETVDYLSLAVANITVCFDPELIILGGGVSGSVDLLIEPIIKRITGAIPKVPRIEGSVLGENASILGSVVCVFQKVTDYAVVQTG